MKWLSSIGSEPSKARVTPSSTHSEVHISLALNVLFHQIRRKDRKYNILDLGPAFSANVDFFSQFLCSIQIEDFYRTLNSFDFFSPENGVNYDAIYDYLLPYSKNSHFDVILTWDIFNYLERDQFKYLVRHLSKFCRSGTLLLALISTLKHIPENPINFKIVDSQSLIYQTSSTVLLPCPQYQETDLNQLMSSFRVCNSFLLRHGMKEYLFVRE